MSRSRTRRPVGGQAAFSSEARPRPAPPTAARSGPPPPRAEPRASPPAARSACRSAEIHVRQCSTRARQARAQPWRGSRRAGGKAARWSYRGGMSAAEHLRGEATHPLRYGGGLANIYEYAGDDPVNFADPGGEFSLGWCVAHTAAAALSCKACVTAPDAPACAACLLSIGLYLETHDCRPGPPAPPAPPAPPVVCPPGYERGGWLQPDCVPIPCYGADCPNQCSAAPIPSPSPSPGPPPCDPANTSCPPPPGGW
jgi:hypothetical protein